MSADARDITASDPNGAAPCAPRDARRNPTTSTTSTHMAPERRKRSFETSAPGRLRLHSKRLAVSSSKAVLGTVGAAGALEMVATAPAIHKRTIPPTANFEEVDPDCDLDVGNIARQPKSRSRCRICSPSAD
jgi:3-oxoacyl-(acyl-carrier-protein) synthase